MSFFTIAQGLSNCDYIDGQNAFLDSSQSTFLDRAAVKNLPQATNFFSSYGPNQWLRSLNPELGSVPYIIHEDGWFEAKTAVLEGSRPLSEIDAGGPHVEQDGRFR